MGPAPTCCARAAPERRHCSRSAPRLRRSGAWSTRSSVRPIPAPAATTWASARFSGRPPRSPASCCGRRSFCRRTRTWRNSAAPTALRCHPGTPRAHRVRLDAAHGARQRTAHRCVPRNRVRSGAGCAHEGSHGRCRTLALAAVSACAIAWPCAGAHLRGSGPGGCLDCQAKPARPGRTARRCAAVASLRVAQGSRRLGGAPRGGARRIIRGVARKPRPCQRRR